VTIQSSKTMQSLLLEVLLDASEDRSVLTGGAHTHTCSHHDALALPSFPILQGWDDFFGPEVYGPNPDMAWRKFMNAEDELLLTCHLLSCS
jgi:hypothetical protein